MINNTRIKRIVRLTAIIIYLKLLKLLYQKLCWLIIRINKFSIIFQKIVKFIKKVKRKLIIQILFKYKIAFINIYIKSYNLENTTNKNKMTEKYKQIVKERFVGSAKEHRHYAKLGK